MIKMDFSIENNGDKLTIGEKVTVKGYLIGAFCTYMIEHSLGMSSPVHISKCPKNNYATVLEIKKTPRFNIAVLGFDE